MSSSFAKTETLTGTIFAPMDWLRSLALVIGFSLLTALAAQVVIPIPPVPFTAQTFAVLLTGALLGSRLGALSMIAYLIEGASGLPFFYGGHGGIQHLLFSPTTGFLLSYPVAAFVVGYLAEHGWDRKFITSVAAMSIGSALILLFGTFWLARFFPFTIAVHEGATKFLVGDIAKVLLAACVLPSGWALLEKTSRDR